MMWHEARKQERKIRGMLVDYKRRAERRKDYYEKIRADPTQFLQLHGRPCKIHLDPAVAIAGDSPVNMMPWQGNQDVLIDRFDVRAHLDLIPEINQNNENELVDIEERQINYERYRILVQNDFLGVGEEKFLRQLNLEEQYGPIMKPVDVPDAKLKKNSSANAAIGYTYDDGPTPSVPNEVPLPNAIDASHLISAALPNAAAGDLPSATDELNVEDEDDDDEDDSDLDFDLCVDINKVDTKQAHEMNKCAHMYGMHSNDFFSFLTRDVEEAENLRIAREQEEEKAMYSGRKARRERRAYRDKKLMGRKISPPSYASRKSPTYFAYRESKSKSLSKSRSRSGSPGNAGQVTYITSFGGEEPATTEISKSSCVGSTAGHSKSSSSVRYRSRTLKSSEQRSHSRSGGGGGRSPVSRSRHYSSSSRRHSRSRSNSKSRRNSRSKIVTSKDYRRRSRSLSHGKRRSRSRSRTRGSDAHAHKSSYSRSSNSNIWKKPNESNKESHSPNKRKFSNVNEHKSPSPVMIRSMEVPPPPVITRYYGRNQNQSSSELSYSSGDESVASSSANTGSVTGSSQYQQSYKSIPDKSLRSGFGNSGGRNKQSSSGNSASSNLPKLTPQERLKRKMQAQLNKQFKADKRAERVRLEKAEQERIDRAEEMREMSIKLRRRERQKRHQYYADELSANGRYSSFSSSSSSSSSPERSHSSSRRRRRRSHRRSKSRSRSRSHSRGHGRSSRRRSSRSSSSDSKERISSKNKPLVDY